MKFLSHELIYKRKKFKPGSQCALRTACAWFLKIDPMQIVCMCVCLCVCVYVSVPRLLITSGVMWRDMDSIRLVEQVL